MRFSLDLGVASVRRARHAIEATLGREAGTEPLSEKPRAEWNERGGVFVTLRTYPDAELRGCIGFPRPVLPLGRAIDEAAAAAAREDPRFLPLRPAELGAVVVEVSLLSVPEPIGAADAAGRIASVGVGRDGLIVSVGGASGLLLPQVAVEERWSAEEFLDRTCEKAGLPRNAWRHASTRVERFEAAVFGEVAPQGEVVSVLAGPAATKSSARPRAVSRR